VPDGGGAADNSAAGDSGWRHGRECLRMTFTMDPASVQVGIAAIGEEVRRLQVS